MRLQPLIWRHQLDAERVLIEQFSGDRRSVILNYTNESILRQHLIVGRHKRSKQAIGRTAAADVRKIRPEARSRVADAVTVEALARLHERSPVLRIASS